MRRRLRFLLAGIFIPGFCLQWATGSAQSNVPDLIAAIQRGESVRSHLRELWRLDSSRTYEVAAEVQLAYERLGEKFGKAQTDSLLRIQAIGWANDPGDPGHWLVQRGLLAMGHAADYPGSHLAWAMEAIREAPLSVPRMLVEHAGHALATELELGKTPLAEAATDWVALDQAMLLRQLQSRTESEDWAKLQVQLSLEMRSALPDCEALTTHFAKLIANGNPPMAECRAYLVVHDLQGCDPSSLWEVAKANAVQLQSEPWLHRLVAEQAFNRRDWSEAIQHWQKASESESRPIFQAHDELQIAAVHQAQAAYRQARSAIMNAMRLAPAWGEPYIALMDLYIAGSDPCGFSEFDKKALNWLLIGLCKELRSIDAQYAQEADERQYRYLQNCPSREEASFLGWNPGDTYPIKCWMSTSTVVQ